MKTLAEISNDDLQKVIDLYFDIFGGHNYDFLNPEGLRKDLGSKETFYEYRFGSKWTMHSKLEFHRDQNGHITVGFNENFDPIDRIQSDPIYIEALALGERFVTEANAILG